MRVYWCSANRNGRQKTRRRNTAAKRHRLTHCGEQCRAMTSEKNPYAANASCAAPTQLALFPLDPWGAETPIALLERPHPGIARAMVGTLSLGDWRDPKNRVLKCLAVTQDGTFAASISVTPQQLKDPDALWQLVAHALSEGKQRLPLSSARNELSTPADCLATWSKPGFWMSVLQPGRTVPRAVNALTKLQAILECGSGRNISHKNQARREARAQEVINQQIFAGVLHVLSALTPERYAVLTQRKRLSLQIVNEIIRMAGVYGTSALAHALEALITESLAVLHLISSDQSDGDAKRLRDANLQGHGLPDHLAELGFAKAPPRLPVGKPVPRSETRTSTSAMNAAPPLPNSKDLAAFSRLKERLATLNIQQGNVTTKLLDWCIQPGYRTSGNRLQRVLDQAAAFVAAAKGLTGTKMKIDDALLLALALAHVPTDSAVFGEYFCGAIDPSNIPQLVLGVSKMSGIPMGQLTQNVFNAHPGIPTAAVELQEIEIGSIHTLSTMQLATAHGVECENCLRFPMSVVRYLADGAALYGVRTVSGSIATVALRYDRTEDNPKVQVAEISGKKNAVARFDLCRIAQSLADSWTTAQGVDAWVHYEEQRALWLRQVIPAAAQESQRV